MEKAVRVGLSGRDGWIDAALTDPYDNSTAHAICNLQARSVPDTSTHGQCFLPSGSQSQQHQVPSALCFFPSLSVPAIVTERRANGFQTVTLFIRCPGR